MRIVGTKTITATTTAQDVSIGYRDFIISNAGSVGVYFKEKDGVAVTSANGFFLPAGTVLQKCITADTLSVISASDTAAVSILLLDV